MARPERTVRRTFVLPEPYDRPRIGRMEWLADIRPTIEAVYDMEFSHFGVGVTSIPMQPTADLDEQVFVMGSSGGNIVNILDNYAVLSANNVGWITIDTTFKPVQVTLPKASENANMEVTTSWIAGANAATVTSLGGDVGGSAPPFTIPTLNDSVTWKSDGTDWIAV